MSVWTTLRRSNFFIRLRSWEYWPFGIVQFPAIVYWLWLSLKARTPFFFSASNPGIVMGGMFGESKFEVLLKVPSQYRPRMAFVPQGASVEDVLRIMRENDLALPLIFKPDLGERGFQVKRISAESMIDDYLESYRHAFIIQELVNLSKEFGVFYTRFPDEQNGRVTSVVGKEMLAITGDGESTLAQLITSSDRAKLQWKKLQQHFAVDLEYVLPAGQRKELVSIGNHALGTKFLDETKLIDDRLHTTFDNISQQIEGFYFGRYDLRCATVEDLYTGNFKVLELNGCGAEPAHIYEPGFSLFRAMKVLLQHWNHIYRVSMQNKKRGASFISFGEAREYYRRFKASTR